MQRMALAFSLLITWHVQAQIPAVPLIVHDPYLSVWSMADRLTDDWPRHWTGATMGMAGLLRVDDKAFRWCGLAPREAAAAEQIRREVGLTTSSYSFSAGGVELAVTFRTPVGPNEDLVQLSRSVSSISFSARSADGKPHDAQIYLDLSGEWCVNSTDDDVGWSRHRASGLEVLSMGKVEQPVLKHAGDHRKIDWGRVYLASVASGGASLAAGGHQRSRSQFAASGSVPEHDDLFPRRVNDDWPVLAVAIALGGLAPTGQACAPRHVLIGYDEGSAIELFGRALRPLWRSAEERDLTTSLLAAQKRLDDDGLADPASDRFLEAAAKVGGAGYAKLVSLAYRQVLAGHKIVADWDGTPLMFAKENTSNGCIATVDVIYPACPFYLYHNPEMLKASLRPLLVYASSRRWKFPFAPHDLGTYPKANGQVYGGGEASERNQMPVEESGNMLLMLGALAKVEGNADFSRPYFPILETWAEYLKQHGLDPEHQLCTDDFAGHLARNANLSAKTCVALGAYARLLGAAGLQQEEARWRAVAEDYARKWLGLAAGPDATVLAFGAPSGQATWSQKYNLVWDRVLDLGLFPDEVFAAEMAWYRRQLGKFGLPLDSRKTYTKLDWTVWSACLTRRRDDFDAVLTPVYAWVDASPPPSRVPLSDWYETTDGRTQGMHSRTVVGGIWMPLLMHKLGAGWR
jgi:Glutaminase A six helical-hairpin domain/Domain of unknown function (DUF5127)/Domain of unknown function (DUF4964)